MPRSGKNNERIEQVPRGREKTAEIEPLRPQAEHPDKRYNDLAKFPSENPYPVLRIHKDGTVLYANKASEGLLKARSSGMGQPAPAEWRRLVKEVLVSGCVAIEEVKDDGRVFAIRAVPITGSNYVNFYGVDITERKTAEEERELMIKLLSLINSDNQTHKLMKLVTVFLKDWSGCEAVGIRLHDGEDFPYFITSGFPEEFVLAESKLCSLNELGEPVRDSQGRVYLECMCGNIISGRFDPARPFFTKHGSFWTNSTTDLLATTTKADRLAKTRNRCNTAGYESVALIPLRTGKETFGLLQFNSKQRGCFTPEKISLLERLADNLAISLAQRKAEEALRESEDRFKTLADETSDSIVIHDGERILEVNKAFGKMWGCEPQKAIGAKMDEFVTPASLEVLKDRIRSGYDKPYEAIAVRKDGTQFNVEITGKPITYKGRTVRIATTRDITERKHAEEALRESEERLKAALDAAELGTWDWNLVNGQITWAGHHERLFGFEEGEFDGRIETFRSRIHPDDLEGLKAAIEKSKKEGSEYSHQYRVVWPDGTIRWIAGKGRCHYDQTGRAVRMLGTVQDITERKQAEEALLVSEARYRRLFEAARDGILILDADSGLIVDVNPFIENILGYPHKGFLDKHLWEIGFFKDIAASKETFLELQTKGYVRYENLPLKTKDGRHIAVEFVSNVYMVDHKKVIQCNIRDITDRARAEESLQISETRFRELFNNMSSGVAVYEAVDDGSDFIIRDFNAAGQRMEKTSKEDAVGKRVTEVFPGVKEMGLLDVFQRVWQTGRAERHPTTLYKDGRIGGWRENNVYKLPSGEIVAVYDDVTERKQAEHKILEHQNNLKQLAARLTLTEERERRRIAGEIHDEISQTLAMVNIKLDTLRNSPQFEASAAEIEEISSSVEKVIQETRTLTFELSNPLLYVLGIEAAVAEWLSEQVQVKHGIATEFQDDGKAKPLDDDVKMMLFRNVRELLINCIKHANAGKVRVNIRRTDGSVEIVVEDNGVGFDPAEVRSTAGKSAKFGLFSVRESLEGLGGHFKIESKPGAGCTVTMIVPLKRKRIDDERNKATPQGNGN